MKKFMNILLLIFLLTFTTGCSLLSDLHVHTFDGSSTGASIANKCTQYGCTVGKLPPRDDYYDKAIKYNFDEEVITNMANIETEILNVIDESVYEKENSSKINELGKKASTLLKEYETLYVLFPWDNLKLSENISNPKYIFLSSSIILVLF